jgi:hypothetical protein
MIVPLAYFVSAHVALLLAMITAAREPATTMVFLHPTVAGTVHLVTLGWITGTILGAVYVVGPLGLRMRIVPRGLDYVALVLYLLGASGLVTHFWIAEYSGMAGSAAFVWIAVVLVIGRLWHAMRQTALEPAVKLHLTLACMNFMAAGGMGVLLGLNRVWPLLGGATIRVMYAHAHLAAIGWAIMLAVGVAYRVLPMVLPARPPTGRRLLVIAWAIEAGLVVLVPALIIDSHWAVLGAALISAGLALFVVEAVRMTRRRLPPNRSIRVPFVAPLHVAFALVCLTGAIAFGLALAWPAPEPRALPVGLTYGVVGLLGFLGQLIAAVQARLSPLFAWYWVAQRRGSTPPLQTPYTLPAWRTELLSAVLWIAGIVALAIGAFYDWPRLFASGAVCIAGAVTLGLVSLIVTTIVAFARERGPHPDLVTRA